MSYRNRERYTHLLQGEGLEIGGLNSPLPVPGARVLYSDVLTPEEIDALYPGSKHPDIISDSESFPDCDDGSFDFVIANHVIEHVTDPIRALTEWYRIIRPGGILFLAVPDKRFTFDRDRERTTLEHLINDHESELETKDLNYAHLKDWATHVEGLEQGSQAWQEWVDYEYNKGYSVHNHVWQIEDILELFQFLAEKHEVVFEIVAHNDTPLFDLEFILILRKLGNPGHGQMQAIRSRYASLRRRYVMLHGMNYPFRRLVCSFLPRVKGKVKRLLGRG